MACAGGQSPASVPRLDRNTQVEIIAVYDSQFVRLTPGVAAPMLSEPVAIHVLPGGNLLIADRATGALLRMDSAGVVRQAARVSSPTGPSALRSPRFMRADASGNIYVSDGTSDRVAVYDARLRPLPDLYPPYGALGFPPGQLAGVAIDPYGEILVADILNRCVYRFDPGGRYLSYLSGDDIPWARLSRPTGVAAVADGSTLIVDPGDRRIVHFDNSGTPGNAFGATDLKEPVAVAIDRTGQVYVADPGIEAVAVFTRGGRLSGIIDADRIALPDRFRPTDVAVADSTVYIADPRAGRVLALRFRAMASGAD